MMNYSVHYTMPIEKYMNYSNTSFKCGSQRVAKTVMNGSNNIGDLLEVVHTGNKNIKQAEARAKLVMDAIKSASRRMLR